MRDILIRLTWALAMVAIGAMPHRAAAELAEVRIIQQYGMILAGRELRGRPAAASPSSARTWTASSPPLGDSRYINGSAALVHLHRTRASATR